MRDYKGSSRRAIVAQFIKAFPRTTFRNVVRWERARDSTITRKLHSDLSPVRSNVILRKLENDLDRERGSRSRDLIHHTRVVRARTHLSCTHTRAYYMRAKEREREGERERERERERQRLHTFPHGNRQAIVVIKETDEGTKRRNKRVGWSRPAVYGALHLLAPYNPPRASATCVVPPYVRLYIRFTTC